MLDDRTEAADPSQAAALLAEAAIRDPATLPWTDDARQLQSRIGRMRALDPQGWPDFADPSIAAELGPFLTGIRRLGELDLAKVMRTLLGFERLRRLDHALPPVLALPHGEAVVDYCQEVPIASARAQAFYGLATTPKLADGKVALRLALLSPAGRPIAITADLAGFWRTGWPDARRDMRGRYPKHDWPENP